MPRQDPGVAERGPPRRYPRGVSEFTAYQPAVPAGLPSGHSLPVPARPRALRLLGMVALGLGLVACGLLTVVLITKQTGPVAALDAALLAAVPVVPVIGALMWLDRYEAEPAALLALAAAWGAGVATLVSLVVNSASVHALQHSGGGVTRTVVLVAPIVEETTKALAIVLILAVRRREFDGVVDGVVYAGMAGVGFAFVENVLYLGRTMTSTGHHGTMGVFLLRCVVSPFAHPLFTAATGVGIGVAVSTRNRMLRPLAPLLGWVCAVALHAVWNVSAVSGVSGFFTAYVAFQMPVFLLFVVLALVARRREGRLITRHLAVYATTGWLAPRELRMLGSLPLRREARAWAQRTGGPAARAAMRDFQELGSELAFLRDRMVRGSAASDAQEQEYAILAGMSALRAQFLPPVA